MDQIQILGPDFEARKLTGEEIAAGNHVFSQCMAVKKDEKVLIVADNAKLREEAAIFFQTARNFSNQVTLAVIQSTNVHGAEPPAELSNLMFNNDVILLVTTYSLSHTQARFMASEKGVRIISMPGITKEIILRSVKTDYGQISHLSKKIGGHLTIAESARLTSPKGTDITFSLTGRQGWADTGLFTNPGDFGNFPAGEAFTAPVEGKSDGIVVFDGAMADIFIDEPIKILVKQGIVTAIEGGTGAKQLQITLNSIGEDSANIAELGVGTNISARLESSLLEIEKVYGTVHIALGNNKQIGGTIDTPFHADGVILSPTLELDGQAIIKDGEFVI